jgi:hypothetical protein
MNGVLSFGSQCLRWKVRVAFKAQQGWPNFTAPYNRRFLTAVTTVTDDRSGTGGISSSGATTSHIDQWTGATTFSPMTGLEVFPDFPYGAPTEFFTGDPNISWTITDTSYKKVQLFFEGAPAPRVLTFSTQLSNEYSIAGLEADLTTLIKSVDLDSMAWNSLQKVTINEFTGYGPNVTEPSLPFLLPNEVNYEAAHGGLQAAAWNIWAPGSANQDGTFSPNFGCKLVGNLALPGNYCKKTFFLDITGHPLDQRCDSGIGSCASPFEVDPAPMEINRNNYALIQPNCVCGQ